MTSLNNLNRIDLGSSVAGLPSSQEGSDPIGGTPLDRAIPTTCIETIGGDPNTALRLSFQIKVF